MNQLATPKRAITFDRARLADVMCHSEEEPASGVEQFGDHPADQIARAVLHAEQEHALSWPAEIDVIVTVLQRSASAVVISLRESNDAITGEHLQARRDADLLTQRQVSTWSIAISQLMPENADTFDGLCKTLEAVCEEVTRLLPTFDALLDGEQRLIERIAEPLTVLKYDTDGRLGSYPSSVDGLTDGDAEQARILWPLLVEALEDGLANDEWDGDRQRAYLVEDIDRPHLARQLFALRDDLIANGDASAEQLPEPNDGLAAYLP